MSEPRRPELQPRWQHRSRSSLRELRERVRTRRELRAGGPPPDADVFGPSGGGRDGAVWWTALSVVGAVALAVGSLWLWQTWSQRSDAPIDDLLPMLADVAETAAAEEATSEVATPDSPRADGLAGVVAAPEPGSSTGGEVSEPTPVPLIIVHVSGAVVSPGVVHLSAGSRVFEAIDRAGGTRSQADVDRVNLAAPLVDGERIHVPLRGEEVAPALVQPDRPSSGDAGVPDPANSGDVPPIVDLNQATEAELQALPGIGPATAGAIVQTREQRGPFLDVDELLEVPGIGPSKLAQLRPYVQVQPAR